MLLIIFLMLSVILLVCYCVVLVRPYFSLALFPLISLFTRFSIGNIQMSPEKLYILLLLPVLLIVIFYRKTKKFKTNQSKNILSVVSSKSIIPKDIKISFICFWVLLLISQIVNARGIPSFSTLNYVLGYLGKGFLVYLIVYFIDNERKFKLCLQSLVISLSIVVVLGFLEILLSKDFFVFRFEEGLFYLPVSQYTPLYNPNLLARNILILFPFAVFGLYYFRKKFLFFCLALLGVIGSFLLIISTLSRAGIFAFGVEIMLFIYFLRKIIINKVPFLIPLMASVVVFCAMLFGDIIIERYINMFEALTSPLHAASLPEINIRMRIWLASIAIIKDYPIWGVGLDKLEDFLLTYGSIRFIGSDIQAMQVHGSLLKFTVIGGMITGISLVILIYFFVKFLLKQMKFQSNFKHKFFVQSSLVSTTGVLISSIAADPIYWNILWVTVGLVLAGILKILPN